MVASIFPHLRCTIPSFVACTIRCALSSTPVLCPPNTNESLQAIYTDCWYRQNFLMPVSSAPKRFFKALFIGTRFGIALRRMSHTKVAPKGLKPHECERNADRSKPPIPYIPEKDVLHKAVDSSANTLKLTLPHKVELCVPVWSKGTIRLKNQSCKDRWGKEVICMWVFCMVILWLYDDKAWVFFPICFLSI